MNQKVARGGQVRDSGVVRSEDVATGSAANRVPVAQGMRPIDHEGRVVSWFEFWPLWLMYVPVAVHWLLLSLRHRSFTLPLVANPRLPLAGMVGIGKSQLLKQARGECADSVLRWVQHRIGERPADIQAVQLRARARRVGIEMPFVCKPDIGCRGSGVRLVSSLGQLRDYISAYPVGSAILAQKLASWEPEAGIFYVRYPDEKNGRIASLALKYSPHLVGDGKSTLAELINRDRRAGKLRHLYEARHRQLLDRVLDRGETFRLVFSISHCRGAVFRDAADLITPQLTQRIDRLMLDLPDFHYGRLDVKFRDIEALRAGEHIEILEINAASAESLHIWDRNARLGTAIKTLLWQYRTLFALGAANRRRGFSPPGLGSLLRAWQRERRLKRFYPPTD